MELSVGYTFAPGLIRKLAAFSCVREIYGKLDRDSIGGGRSTYTLRRTTRSLLRARVDEAHRHGIEFNYLINAAWLGGLEQTRSGRKKIRRLLDFIASCNVDSVTVASPCLASIVKTQYPQFKLRVGVFAVVDSPLKAQRWECLGADTICVSAIACNRDFARLEAIRNAVSCRLQLIVNASCIAGCAYELTHMQMLSQSSRSGDPLRGFVLDYCFLNCSSQRLDDPLNFIRSIWVRPEDLHLYEKIGYDSFKIVERSSPEELVLKRVAAYAHRSFDGNLWELVAPVAYITARQKASLCSRFRVIAHLFRPNLIKTSSMLLMKKYAEKLLVADYQAPDSPVYIDNKALEGFLEGLHERECAKMNCEQCSYCSAWVEKAVRIDPQYRDEVLELAGKLDEGLRKSTHWL
ncbi:MAG: peptidase U32 [Chitinivibrionales bacterium]|nr:peptidase U32 [Chitinivibrionales bacterium]